MILCLIRTYIVRISCSVFYAQCTKVELCTVTNNYSLPIGQKSELHASYIQHKYRCTKYACIKNVRRGHKDIFLANSAFVVVGISYTHELFSHVTCRQLPKGAHDNVLF